MKSLVWKGLRRHGELGPLVRVHRSVVDEGVGVKSPAKGGRSPVHTRGALVEHHVPRLHSDVVVVPCMIINHQRPVFLDVLETHAVSQKGNARRGGTALMSAIRFPSQLQRSTESLDTEFMHLHRPTTIAVPWKKRSGFFHALGSIALTWSTCMMTETA